MNCSFVNAPKLAIFKTLSLSLFRRPGQLRWGASNSLIIQGEEGEGGEGEISFLGIVSDSEAKE